MSQILKHVIVYAFHCVSLIHDVVNHVFLMMLLILHGDRSCACGSIEFWGFLF